MDDVPDQMRGPLSTRASANRPHPADLVLRGIPAVLHELRPARNSVSEWLAGFVSSEMLRSDILLAVYEAMANAVAHAYPDAPGVFDVHLGVAAGGRTIAATVVDYGRWDSTTGVSPFHGRGLPLMRALAVKSDITTDAGGTRVRLQWAFGVGDPRQADPAS